MASRLGAGVVPLPATIAHRMQRTDRAERAHVAQPEIHNGRLLLTITTETRRDQIRFSVPDGFRAHPDLVAAAVTPLIRNRYRRIEFAFPVSERVRHAVAVRANADVVAAGVGDPRPPGSQVLLNFSGGMDSLAAWLLAPDDVRRLAIDFGPWFRRERAFFETLEPDVVCETDFRSKGYAGNDWLFMGSAGILFADHLDLGWIGFGTNFESSASSFHRRGWVPNQVDSSPLPTFVTATGLRGATYTRGLTEFAGSLVVDRFGPHLVDGSMRSLARSGAGKGFRKRLAYDSAVAFRGGPAVDLDRRMPRTKIRMWRSYPTDFAMVAFMAMYPPRFVEQFVRDVEPDVFEAARQIRPDFLFRNNPLFVTQIPPRMRDTVMRRMGEAGVENYREDDWVEYDKLRRILAVRHDLAD